MPIHASTVFSEFELKVGTKTLMSQVWSNEEASVIYEDNVAEGKPAGLGRFTKKTWDILKFYLGAIPAK